MVELAAFLFVAIVVIVAVGAVLGFVLARTYPKISVEHIMKEAITRKAV